MADIALVHGAWVGSSCWDHVAPGLRDRGHRVETVDLHRGSLSADTQAAQDVINSFDDAPIVCGWSYGGMVITGLELPEGSHLVYLCAYMPDGTESAWALSLNHPSEIATLFHVDDAGDVSLVSDEIDALVWADAPRGLADAARASLRPQSMETLLATPERVSWQTLPTTYVICRQDRTINPDLQRELAQRANRVIEWDTSHAPMLSRPDLLIDLLDRVATGR